VNSPLPGIAGSAILGHPEHAQARSRPSHVPVHPGPAISREAHGTGIHKVPNETEGNMADIRKHFDRGSSLVIGLTLILFVAALFLKGLTHDLLLEAGVFLVSVKLLIMSYKHSIAADELHEQLNDIRSLLHRLETRLPNP
jgi:hypothetical protein